MVFDIGRVLLDYQPVEIVLPYVSCREDAEKIADLAYSRDYWDPLDEGKISENDIIEAVKNQLPERLVAPMKKSLEEWHIKLPEIAGMKDLINDLKNQYGKRLLVLSNISRQFATHADEIPILSQIEERVFSSVCGFTKPDPRIFQYVCEKFDLNPTETFFIDDNVNNIATAKSCGWQTFLFKGNADDVRAALLPLI